MDKKIVWALVALILIVWFMASTQPTDKEIQNCVERSGNSYEYCELALSGY
jgi:hypothetical protein